MDFIKNILGIKKKDKGDYYKLLLSKFFVFKDILELNNSTLRIISDLEEKNQGDYIFDENYINQNLSQLETDLEKMILGFYKLSNIKNKYLLDKFKDIQNKILFVHKDKSEIENDSLVLDLKDIDKTFYNLTGSKNSNLGELKNRLNLKIPSGFVITANAYNKFMSDNNLSESISNLIKTVDIKNLDALTKTAQKIKRMILDASIPNEIADEVNKHTEKYKEILFAVRSSALGEDSDYSFAGQYKTFLSVRSSEILDKYKEVLASKYSVNAIYYFLNHNFEENNLAMCVGCFEMINGQASGVIYSRNPANSDDLSIIISATIGLGFPLVDGVVTPDEYLIRREDHKILDRIISNKKIKGIINSRGKQETKETGINANRPTLDDMQIKELSKLAVTIEEHYGEAQDIEFTIDEIGEIYILQSRPLRIIRQQGLAEDIDTSNYKMILTGGISASPGVSSGKTKKFSNVGGGDYSDKIIIAEKPIIDLAPLLDRAKGLIVKMGGIACHLVTVAREYRIPTLILDFKDELLPDDCLITLDATNLRVYEGVVEELIERAMRELESYQEEGVLKRLRIITSYTSKLTIDDEVIKKEDIEAIDTYHDIVRYIHQKSMMAMFEHSRSAKQGIRGVNLDSEIPLLVNIIELNSKQSGKRKTRLEEIESEPFAAFWKGIMDIGWTAPPEVPDLKGLMSVVSNDMINQKRGQLAEKSYAVLSDDYMVLNLRMGYHFTTIESICSDVFNRNYIRLSFKEGGADYERRRRRIKLLVEILEQIGFTNRYEGDFLETKISSIDKAKVKDSLYKLGQLTMLTKQLDVVLSDDEALQEELRIIKSILFGEFQ